MSKIIGRVMKGEIRNSNILVVQGGDAAQVFVFSGDIRVWFAHPSSVHLEPITPDQLKAMRKAAQHSHK